ncbi:MAG: hypothetical protein KZQ83_10370 [gamma proteobacterium symbiont of Taylorina sp.]|nr:hypothetical protein [gamma proteobacterium symbiont of Taylorina sp.]
MLESIRQSVINANNNEITIVLVVLALICAVSLYSIFRFFHRSRIIDDTPTSKIRSAHQGFIELEGVGHLMQGTPIVSPLSNQQCLWYSYKIEHKVKSSISVGKSGQNNNSWETVDTGVSDNLFLLNDGSGICVIDPEGAAITPSFSKTWYGPREYRINNITTTNTSGMFNQLMHNNDYRYTEKRIDVGHDLYILGLFKTVGGRREKFDESAEVRDLLAAWKKKPNVLLARFDENGDGEIDLQEWQKVMDAAQQEISQSLTERLVQPEIHTVSKPLDSRRPYIISVESQTSIASRYRWYSRGSLISFFMSGISFVWIIGIRLAS